MSVTLETATNRRRVNAWNWGALHQAVTDAAVFPDEIWEPTRFGAGALDAAQCAELAGFLREVLLPMIPPGTRMFIDGTITDVPDDGTFFREQDEMWRNYSLHHDVLVDVIALLEGADGVRFS